MSVKENAFKRHCAKAKNGSAHLSTEAAKTVHVQAEHADWSESVERRSGRQYVYGLTPRTGFAERHNQPEDQPIMHPDDREVVLDKKYVQEALNTVKADQPMACCLAGRPVHWILGRFPCSRTLHGRGPRAWWA